MGTLFEVNIKQEQLNALAKKTRANVKLLKKKLSEALYGQALIATAAARRLTRPGGGHFNGSGRLSRSLDAEWRPGQLTVNMITKPFVPYARIQAWGGRTKPHEIVGKRSPRKMLAFQWYGKMAFFKRVQHPGSRIVGTEYPQVAWDRTANKRAAFMKKKGREMVTGK